jgi:acyl-[acyl-carrier-protein] desaturase
VRPSSSGGVTRVGLCIHLNEVVMPVLNKWRIFEHDDFTGEAARMRDDLGVLVKDLEAACEKFELSKQRYLDRAARRAESITAAEALTTKGTQTRSRRLNSLVS